MNQVYWMLFLMLFPIMSLFTSLVTIALWFLQRKRVDDAKTLLVFGTIGAIGGYLVAFLYFYITRSESIVSLLNLSLLGLFIGSGYSMMLTPAFWKFKRSRGQTKESNQ